MKMLHDAIEQALRGLPDQVLSSVIEKKLAAQGVKLLNRQRDVLIKRILEDDDDTLRIHRNKSFPSVLRIANRSCIP